jgi:chromosome segregation ATPase
MNLPELLQHEKDYLEKHGMPVDRARQKAITAYNAVHVLDPIPDDIWEKIDNAKDGAMAEIRAEAEELSKLQDRVREGEDLIEHLQDKVTTLEQENKALRELLEEAGQKQGPPEDPKPEKKPEKKPADKPKPDTKKGK